MDLSTQILSDITVHMKYARYLEKKALTPPVSLIRSDSIASIDTSTRGKLQSNMLDVL